ncbi:Vacuolar_ATP synthase subunit d [Hexamita inflata]|nr:Vacuolar ATP synthase subunit d [Hexamita inflata]
MCEQLKTLGNAADEGVFRAVLESTPVSAYFQEADVDLDFFQQVQAKIDDREQKNLFLQELEVCKQRVMKQYYKRFVQYCKMCGGNTWEAMRKLLAFEMDMCTIMLRVNMLKSTNDSLPGELYPQFGELYPFIHDVFAGLSDYDSVMNALNDYPEYRDCMEQAVTQEKGLLEVFKAKKVAYLEECINTQYNLGFIYAYLQLREMEAENVFLMVQGCVMAQSDAARFQLRK